MARVRTLDEATTLPDDAVSWIEVRKGTDTAYAYSVLPRWVRYSILWPEEYGKKWRMWDGKATKKERKETPWDEEVKTW